MINKNPFSFSVNDNVSCHGVIRSNGQVGGFALGPIKKLQLLKKECLFK